MGIWGDDWLLSNYYREFYDSVPHEKSDSGEPLQIVRWEKVGYELPNPSIWSSEDFDMSSIHPSFTDDPDFRVIDNAIAEDSIEAEVSLFASNHDDPYEIEQHPELGRRPLFKFDGPMSAWAVDVHTVFYRAIDGVFEYTGACIRCKR